MLNPQNLDLLESNDKSTSALFTPKFSNDNHINTGVTEGSLHSNMKNEINDEM